MWQAGSSAREPAEEVEVHAAVLTPLGTFYIANGFASVTGHFFLATDVALTTAPVLEPLEVIAEAARFP